MIFLEFDLSGAEWVVVAYASGDANMIGVVESGKSPHVVTGALISGATEDFVMAEHKLVGNHTDPNTISDLRSSLKIEPYVFLPRSMSIRQAGKKSNHGLNYGMKYKRFALENEVPEADAKPIVEAYSTVAYPGLEGYWQATRDQLKRDRSLVNCFGRKVRLLGEWGNDLFMEAYSFIPQSTVADVCLRAMCLVYEDARMQDVELGAQVHDSLLIQYPTPRNYDGWGQLANICRKIAREYMRPELEYGGRKFRLGCDLKVGLNWGDMHPVATAMPRPELADALEAAIRSATVSSSHQTVSPSPEVSEAAEVGCSTPSLQDYPELPASSLDHQIGAH